MSARRGLERWHAIVANGSGAKEVAAVLSEDAVFHSPVVHTPQRGRSLVCAYLTAAGTVLGGEGFRYVRELVDGEHAMLEFETELEGVHINGVDIIRFDGRGMIVDFKVMIRPLKGVNKVWEMMASELERQEAG